MNAGPTEILITHPRSGSRLTMPMKCIPTRAWNSYKPCNAPDTLCTLTDSDMNMLQQSRFLYVTN